MLFEQYMYKMASKPDENAAGACLGGGGHWAMALPLRTPNFTLDIGLSWKKIRERHSICRKIGSDPSSAISKHAPVGPVQLLPLTDKTRHQSNI